MLLTREEATWSSRVRLGEAVVWPLASPDNAATCPCIVDLLSVAPASTARETLLGRGRHSRLTAGRGSANLITVLLLETHAVLQLGTSVRRPSSSDPRGLEDPHD